MDSECFNTLHDSGCRGNAIDCKGAPVNWDENDHAQETHDAWRARVVGQAFALHRFVSMVFDRMENNEVVGFSVEDYEEARSLISKIDGA